MEKNMSFCKPLFKGFFIAAFPLLIAGCAPPAIQIASWAVDGLLYLTTGKSSSDHIISVATKKDCAVWRVIKGQEICNNLAPAENNDIVVAMNDDVTSTQDGLGTIAERFSARERAASKEMATKSTKATVYRDVQLAKLSFGSTVLSPNKKDYSLSAALAETDAASGTAADASDDLILQASAKSAVDNQEDGLSPIITPIASFGRPLSLTDRFMRWSLRKKNTFKSPSGPETYPSGRPVNTDFPQFSDPALEQVVIKPASERAELQGVNISSRDSSNSELRQLAGLSVADDSLSYVPGITKETLTVPAKISTVATTVKPAIKPVPDNMTRHLVIGSFSNRLNADAFSKQLGVFKTFVASVQLRGATYYRVFARPSPGESLEGLKSRYSKATGAKSWVASLPEYESSKTAALR